MRYGVTLNCGGDVAEYRRRLAVAEDLGYDIIGSGDSPTVFRELLLTLAVAAQTTKRAMLTSMVAVPSARHPVHTASALSGLQDLSGNRMMLGLGTGGSAPAAVGEKTVTRARLRGWVEALRGLLAGHAVQWDGAEIAPPENVRPVKLYVSAYGDASRKLAGEIGDGVILATGPGNPLLPDYIAEVRAAAQAAGRNPADIDVWVMSRFSIAENRDEALADLMANLASAATYGLAGESQLATVPEELRDRVVELQKRYVTTEHTVAGGTNERLVAELGLADYLADRFALVGTPDECRRAVDGLEQLGVSALHVSAVIKRPEVLMERLASALIART